MKITVLGAAGNAGSRVVAEALSRREHVFTQQQRSVIRTAGVVRQETGEGLKKFG
jgi:putative NADH-flavin reductase